MGIPGDIRILRTFRLGDLFLDVGINENIPNFGRGLILFVRRGSRQNRVAISQAYYVVDDEYEEIRKMVVVIEEHLRLPDIIMCPREIDRDEILELLEHAEKKLDEEL
ncbi:MAG: hypothetical protein HY044_00510 [Candidatus Woesebacteria bacterium]|nr:MAG: hypothetical protein HY044_00510 [Candidatus Woesebacteria bacterium]